MTHPKCGAKTQGGKGPPCKNAAGFKTDHVGIGRCWKHGGLTPIKHGRYSKQLGGRIGELVEELEGDPNPLDILPELARARALLTHWMEAAGDTLTDQDADRVLKTLDLVSKIVDRVIKQENANHIKRTDFMRVLSEMGRVVDAHVFDQETKERIQRDWLSIRLA